MVGGNWTNSDGLFLQFGTDKAKPAQAGEYKSFGSVREVECAITLANVTTTATIQDNVTLFPCAVSSGDDSYIPFIESVILEVIVASTASSSPTLSVGFMKTDRSTSIGSDNSILNAIADSGTLNTAGKQTTYDSTTSGHGILIGSNLSTTNGPCYITAKNAAGSGSWSAGVVKVRIRYSVVLATGVVTPPSAALNPGT